jgi:hypothetical protein
VAGVAGCGAGPVKALEEPLSHLCRPHHRKRTGEKRRRDASSRVPAWRCRVWRVARDIHKKGLLSTVSVDLSTGQTLWERNSRQRGRRGYLPTHAGAAGDEGPGEGFRASVASAEKTRPARLRTAAVRELGVPVSSGLRWRGTTSVPAKSNGAARGWAAGNYVQERAARAVATVGSPRHRGDAGGCVWLPSISRQCLLLSRTGRAGWGAAAS